jgi:protease I
MTSWPSLQTDIRNAGGEWVDEELVLDENLVTRRKPDDLPAFNREMIALFGQHQAGKREPRTDSRPSQPRRTEGVGRACR